MARGAADASFPYIGQNAARFAVVGYSPRLFSIPIGILYKSALPSVSLPLRLDRALWLLEAATSPPGGTEPGRPLSAPGDPRPRLLRRRHPHPPPLPHPPLRRPFPSPSLPVASKNMAQDWGSAGAEAGLGLMLGVLLELMSGILTTLFTKELPQPTPFKEPGDLKDRSAGWTIVSPSSFYVDVIQRKLGHPFGRCEVEEGRK